MELGLVDGVHGGREKIELSLFQFVDGTILFCPADDKVIMNYVKLLRCFEVLSGLVINYVKSSMIPIGCQPEWLNTMQRKLGCGIVGLPFKYLAIMGEEDPRRVST